VINGVSAGTSQITYRTAAGCLGSRTVTINPIASAGIISGTPTLCQGTSFTFTSTSAITSGTWSTVTGKVSITSTGVATGVTGGVDTIKYFVSNVCNSSVARYIVTVDPLPDAGTIGGQDTFCVGNTGSITSSAIGGTWSSDNVGVATVSGGIVTPISLGTAVISYSRTNVCGTSVATVNIAVVNHIEAGTISGPDTVCYANTITLTSTAPGGEWSSSSPFVSVGVTNGRVTGLAPGVAVIRHVVSNECSRDTAYYSVYVKYSIDCPTSVAATQKSTRFSLYPNPSHGNINVESPSAGTVCIYSIDGREIVRWNIQAGQNGMTLPEGISAGVYFARFVSVDGTWEVRRIVYE
jgi:hypothetical protein